MEIDGVICKAVVAALMKQKLSRVVSVTVTVAVWLGVGEVRHSGNCR